MQYMLLIYNNEAAWEALSKTQAEAMLAEFRSFTEDIVTQGKFKAGDRPQDVATATTVRVKDGTTLVTDGPFAETREQLGGYYIVDADDLDDAIAIAARVPEARLAYQAALDLSRLDPERRVYARRLAELG